MSEDREAYERLCDMKGFPYKKTQAKVKIGEVFSLDGVGKVKIVHGKRGLEIKKEN